MNHTPQQQLDEYPFASTIDVLYPGPGSKNSGDSTNNGRYNNDTGPSFKWILRSHNESGGADLSAFYLKTIREKGLSWTLLSYNEFKVTIVP
ncbi:hypothetical protein [Armatimonas sp.]|uniref:hypothetical protein n=1 Tax=Armatimonas sp. TaxID=1872638 RepID=UPI0037538042